MTRRPNMAVLAVVALLQALAGCAPQAPKTTPSATAPKEPAPTPPPPPAGRKQGEAPTSPSAVAPRPPQSLEGFTDEPALKDVFFEPDRADIVREGTIIMVSNARWLLARWLVDNLDYLVLIEGHADDKGTREDNVAIAELRAKAAASFLVTMGVPEARLLTISYGSDRRVCKQKSDACAAKNRRVHFRVKGQ